jgi:outer membrane immunogenic protein
VTEFQKRVVQGLSSLLLGAVSSSVAHAGDAGSSRSWQGFHGGIALGAAHGKASPDSTVSLGSPNYVQPVNIPRVTDALRRSIDGNSFSGSGLAGYDIQRGNLVFGIEADLTLMDFSETTRTRTDYSGLGDSFQVENRLETKFSFSIRPKIGYSFGDTMVHAGIGPVIGRFKYSSRYEDTTANNPDDFFSRTRTAWGVSLNVGVNHAIGNDWYLRGDYVFNHFPNAVDGNSAITATGAPHNSGVKHDSDFDFHTVRVGLMKRF